MSEPKLFNESDNGDKTTPSFGRYRPLSLHLPAPLRLFPAGDNDVGRAPTNRTYRHSYSHSHSHGHNHRAGMIRVPTNASALPHHGSFRAPRINRRESVVGHLLHRQLTVPDNVATGAGYMSGRRSLVPNFLAALLSFLVGFQNGLLNTLNPHLRRALSVTNAQASILSTAYFAAYLICPPTIAGYCLRRYGFRVTFLAGLMIMSTGCLLFWPSALYRSFPGFCASMFVAGAGLATLSTASDLFLAICGPPRYSEIRLNLAQALQGVGTFITPLIAAQVFFKDKDEGANTNLTSVQYVYLCVAIFGVALIVMFWLVPLPEITDADMHAQERSIQHADAGPLSKQYNFFLALGALFFYLSGQSPVANYFITFCKQAGKTEKEASMMLAIGQGMRATNRFLGGGLMMIPWVKPRLVLLLCLGTCSVFSILSTIVKGTASIIMLMFVLCGESCCYALVFTLGIRGLGRHTKRGGSLLGATMCAGMVAPPITGALIDKYGAHIAFRIPAACYTIAFLYPIYVNLFKRAAMDQRRRTNVGVDPATNHNDTPAAQCSASSTTTFSSIAPSYHNTNNRDVEAHTVTTSSLSTAPYPCVDSSRVTSRVPQSNRFSYARPKRDNADVSNPDVHNVALRNVDVHTVDLPNADLHSVDLSPPASASLSLSLSPSPSPADSLELGPMGMRHRVSNSSLRPLGVRFVRKYPRATKHSHASERAEAELMAKAAESVRAVVVATRDDGRRKRCNDLPKL